MEKFEPGVQLVLKARPGYWGAQPAFQQIVYRVVPQAENRLLLLKNGDIDIAYDVALKDFASVKADSKLKGYATPTFGTLFMFLNTNKKPWDNVKLRQAIGYVIPYDTIIKEVTYGYARLPRSWMPPGMEGFVPASQFKYDPAKAKALLAEAGFPDGKGLPTLEFSLKQGVPEDESAAVYIQAELQKLGVKMEIKPLSTAAHADLLGKHELAWTFSLWLPYVPDAYYQFFYTTNSGKAPSGCCNYASYASPKMDEYVKTLLTDPDLAKRLAAAKSAQEQLAQDTPMIPMYHPTWNLATRADIAGYSYYSDALIRFQDLSRAK